MGDYQLHQQCLAARQRRSAHRFNAALFALVSATFALAIYLDWRF